MHESCKEKESLGVFQVTYTKEKNIVLYIHFLENNSLSMRSATKRVSLQSRSQMRFLVSFVVPSLVSAVILELTSGS